MASRRTFLTVIARGMVVVPVFGAAVACSGDPDDTVDVLGISPWGVSPSYGSGWDPTVWTGAISAAGVRNVRGFRTDSGGYDEIRAAGFTSTGILLWSLPGEERFPTEDLQGWRHYVDGMLRNYPDVQQWEVWNEPPNFSADPSPASYATILEAAFDTAKTVNPQVQIGLAAKSTHVAWIREAILAGAAGHYDYVTLHPYERAAAVVDGWEEPFMAIVPQLRAMLSEVDADRARVPVEFTEVGATAAQHPGKVDPLSTPEQQARTLVKVMTMGVAQGVRRVSWYDPFDGDYDAGEAAYGLIAQGGRPRRAYTAYKSLIAALGAHPSFAGLIQPERDTFLFVFRIADGRAVVVGWSNGERRTTSFANTVQATNPVTGDVTTSHVVSLDTDPVIVMMSDVDESQKLIGTAASPPAGGGVTRRSVRWDARDGALGLHVRGLGSAVTIDGRAGRVPTGAGVAIAVGPDFDFSASAGTLTIVVRGVREGAGFNLRYDADAPLATLDFAGQRVADDGWKETGTGDWRTLVWSFDDLRLSGMYGYNLMLDSDSQAHSGYQLSEVSLLVLASRGPSTSEA
jgi:hypothetical protein